MDKKLFHNEQANKFLDYMAKFHDRDVLSLFEEWAESKDFSEEDTGAILKEVISLIPKKKILLPRVRIHLKNDPVLLKDIIRFILKAIELADKNNVDEKGKQE